MTDPATPPSDTGIPRRAAAPPGIALAIAVVALAGIGTLAIDAPNPPIIPPGGRKTCQSGPTAAIEFVIGTTIEMVSDPKSAPRGLLSPGISADGVPLT